MHNTIKRAMGWFWRAALAEVGGMRPKPWAVLDECVERGVRYGFMRAHKHHGEVSEDSIRRAVADAVGTRSAKVDPIVAAVMAVLADRPSEDYVCDEIHGAIMGEVAEHFEFPEAAE